MSDLVRCAQVAPGVLEVTLTDAARRNALGRPLVERLRAVLADAVGCRAMIVRAEPGVSTWSAGADIAELPPSAAAAATWANPLDELIAQVRSTRFPVIAAVEGGVWGGAVELVLACDLVVAVDSATFALTPARLGVPYARSGIENLLSVLPTALAREMLFTADPVSTSVLAQHAAVSRVVADRDEMEQVARALAERIAQRAPLAIAVVKAEIAVAAGSPDGTQRADALRDQAWDSADYGEGRAAFAQRRPPRFEGVGDLSRRRAGR